MIIDVLLQGFVDNHVAVADKKGVGVDRDQEHLSEHFPPTAGAQHIVHLVSQPVELLQLQFAFLADVNQHPARDSHQQVNVQKALGFEPIVSFELQVVLRSKRIYREPAKTRAEEHEHQDQHIQELHLLQGFFGELAPVHFVLDVYGLVFDGLHDQPKSADALKIEFAFLLPNCEE